MLLIEVLPPKSWQVGGRPGENVEVLWKKLRSCACDLEARKGGVTRDSESSGKVLRSTASPPFKERVKMSFPQCLGR